MHPTEKPLNQMNRLSDMLYFPVIVNAGATINVLATIPITWQVQPRFPSAAGIWVAIVLGLNLLPVVLLRLTLTPSTIYPPLEKMDFFRDQHKFSDWVYLAASADMAFWILLTWTVSAYRHTYSGLLITLVSGFLITFSPVLFRSRLGRHVPSGR